MNSFDQFGLSAPILKALEQEGYAHPTPIQDQAIPHVMAGRDLQGIAQTGTGKTAAFALPILHRLSASPVRPKPRSARVLVLSPTRELASQIADSFRTYGRNLRVSVTVVFGGVPIGRQQRSLAGGVDVLVATPGRLLDLIDQRSLTLGDVEILVLDEADQMLDLGFIHALRRIVTLVPTKRQTLFFSATMPKAIEDLSAKFIRDPVKVSVTPVATTAERVEQRIIFVPTSHKASLLHHVLSTEGVERALVFTRTKHGADRVVKQLERVGVAAAAIHGNKSQGQRERALADFKSGRSPVLIATDIAARGIDVDGVSHVVNFDLPNIPESYVHRIGRTARAGATGQAISFCNREEREYLRDIEKVTRQRIPVEALPPNLAVIAVEPAAAEPRDERNGGGRGGRNAAPSRNGGRGRNPGPAASRPSQGPRRGNGNHAPVEARAPRPAEGRAPRPAGRSGQAAAAARTGEGGGVGNDIAWLSRGAPSR